MDEKSLRRQHTLNMNLVALMFFTMAIFLASSIPVASDNTQTIALAPESDPKPTATPSPTPTPTPAPQPAIEPETIIVVETVVIEPSPVPTVLIAGESAQVERQLVIEEVLRNPAGKVYGYIKNDKRKK